MMSVEYLIPYGNDILDIDDDINLDKLTNDIKSTVKSECIHEDDFVDSYVVGEDEIFLSTPKDIHIFYIPDYKK